MSKTYFFFTLIITSLHFPSFFSLLFPKPSTYRFNKLFLLTQNIFNDETYKDTNVIISINNLYKLLYSFAFFSDSQTRTEVLNFLNNSNLESVQKEAVKITNHQDKIGRGIVPFNLVFTYNDSSLTDEFLRDLIHDLRIFRIDLIPYKKINATFINKRLFDASKGKLSAVRYISGYQFFGINNIIITGAYIRAEWDHKFNRKFTKEFTFYNSNQRISNVEMMHARHLVDFYENEVFSGIHLSSTLDSLFVWFFLPKSGRQLKEIYEHINTDDKVKNITHASQSCYVDYYLPRFTVESEISLKRHLEKFGIRRVFSKEESTLGYKKGKSISFEDIVHKVRIIVDEDGANVKERQQNNFGEDKEFSGDDRVKKIILFDRPFVMAVQSEMFIELDSVVLAKIENIDEENTVEIVG